MSDIPASESLIKYPCDFPIKVMGKQVPDMAQVLSELVRGFDPAFDPATVEMRPSKAGNYMGLTLTLYVTSREQLDEMYRTLSTHPLVKYTL